MSEYRSEVTIPVTRDNRTFEQRRRDMLTNLERRTSSRRTEQSSVTRGGTAPDSTTSVLTSDGSKSGGLHFRDRDEWDHDVNRWIDQSRRRMNDEIQRMKQDMFALEPVNDFEKDPWGKLDDMRPFDTTTDHSSMMAKMEREMQSLRQQMSSMSALGPTRISGPGGSTVQSSSSRITTSSSTTSSGDARGMRTQSNVQESVKQSRTVNGVTTGTSSHSSTSTTATGPEASRAIEHGTGTPGALIQPTSTSGNAMTFMNNAYELDDDGQVHFKVRFNAQDFAPEDIDVTTVENKLTVSAKKHIKTGGYETTKEFCRTIELPRTIIHEQFQCNLTDDGVLILDAPVKAPDYDSITFDNGCQLSIRPKSETQLKASSSSTKSASLVPIGASEPTILKDGTHGRKLRLEVPVDASYKAEDLCVRMEANSIIVSGKQAYGGSSTRQFTRTYDIPETVDPFTVTAQLIGTTLVIEAPLLCTV